MEGYWGAGMLWLWGWRSSWLLDLRLFVQITAVRPMVMRFVRYGGVGVADGRAMAAGWLTNGVRRGAEGCEGAPEGRKPVTRREENVYGPSGLPAGMTEGIRAGASTQGPGAAATTDGPEVAGGDPGGAAVRGSKRRSERRSVRGSVRGVGEGRNGGA